MINLGGVVAGLSKEAVNFLVVHLVISLNTNVDVLLGEVNSTLSSLVGISVVPCEINVETNIHIREELRAEFN